jgi:hypothetical protein
MKFLIASLLVVPLIGGIFSRWQKEEEPDLDQQILDQLKKAGSDLAKPHDIEFFLYFPTEPAANEGAKNVKVEVDDVKVKLGADKKNWLCLPLSEWPLTMTNSWRCESDSMKSPQG